MATPTNNGNSTPTNNSNSTTSNNHNNNNNNNNNNINLNIGDQNDNFPDIQILMRQSVSTSDQSRTNIENHSKKLILESRALRRRAADLFDSIKKTFQSSVELSVNSMTLYNNIIRQVRLQRDEKRERDHKVQDILRRELEQLAPLMNSLNQGSSNNENTGGSAPSGSGSNQNNTNEGAPSSRENHRGAGGSQVRNWPTEAEVLLMSDEEIRALLPTVPATVMSTEAQVALCRKFTAELIFRRRQPPTADDSHKHKCSEHFCLYASSDRSNLRRHLKQQHFEPAVPTHTCHCPICPFTSNGQGIRRHLEQKRFFISGDELESVKNCYAAHNTGRLQHYI